ncbi:hypothetical protein [Stenotrophomonas bentonitica]
MPLEPAASTARPWVAVYAGGAASTRVRNDDSPPSYEEATRASPLEQQPLVRSQLLPSSRAIPTVVGNKLPAWRRWFSTPPHPDAQQRELQKQLELRATTQRRLDSARNHLVSVLDDHARLAASGRVYCGGGLYEDDECSAIYRARSEVERYEARQSKQQDALMAMLRRNPEQLSPG